MFTIAICDDEPLDREHIRELTQKTCLSENIAANIVCFESAGKLLRSIQGGERYDLLFLDVIMPEQDGMALARQLRRQENKTAIIFISNNREMALQGYEVSAQRYLAKPVDEGLFREGLVFCYKNFQSSGSILFPSDTGIRKAELKDIWYIEISGRKCRVVQENDGWLTSLSMGKLAEMLIGRGFIRCHQSFLVNCNYIRIFHASAVELPGGKIIPVSKHRLKDVRRAFFEYMEG